jgi:hypothetical protein
MRKALSTCAIGSGIAITIAVFVSTADAQHIPPYHGPGAEGQYSGRRPEQRSGATFGNPGGRYIGGPTQYGPAAPSYWTYNRFSNNGFGGLNWFYGPLGGYTPFVTPYGYTTYGYPNFGPYYSYVPLAPVIRQTRPYWIGGDPFDDQGQGAAGNGGGARRPAAPQKLPAQPAQANLPIVPKATSNDALRRSIRLQGIGDEYFAKQDYLQAYANYKQALSVAPSRIEPRFRMALSLAANTHYTQAIEEIKRGLRANPDWPRTGATLDELFGADNILAKNAVLHRVTAWVREDIRDPDRLFLMGVLLHFNDDPDKSHQFFEAAGELSPNPIYAQAFLDAEDAVAGPRPGNTGDEPVPAPAAPQRDGQPARRQGPVIPGLDDNPAEPDPIFRGKKNAPEAPRPKPLAHRVGGFQRLERGSSADNCKLKIVNFKLQIDVRAIADFQFSIFNSQFSIPPAGGCA